MVRRHQDAALFLSMRRERPAPADHHPKHGTHDDAAPPSPRPARATGGPQGPLRHGAVVRGGSWGAARSPCAAGLRRGCGMGESRGGCARGPGAFRYGGGAGRSEAVQAARKERGASLAGATSRAAGSDAPSPRPRTDAGGAVFVFDTRGRGMDESGGEFTVTCRAGGAPSPDAGGQTRPLAQGRSVPAGPRRNRRWTMVAVAQRSERRIVDPETRVRLPSATPACRRKRIGECP